MQELTPARSGILAGGNWIADSIKIIDRWPSPETLANVIEQHEGTGGSPYNVLLGLAKIGVSFPLAGAGTIGTDLVGSQILSQCQVHNIDTVYLVRSALSRTAYTDVMTEKVSGRRTFFHHRGSNATWNGSGIDFLAVSARIFHLGYLLLLDALDGHDAEYGTGAARLLSKAQSAGLRTSIDLVSEDSERFRTVVGPALRYTDYCFLNEIEAEKTCQIPTRDGAHQLLPHGIKTAAKAMIDYGVRSYCIIHFPEGAYALSASGQECWQASLHLPKGYITGTAGAGDAFCAAVLLGLHEDWPLQHSLLAGVCTAAASLSDPTCTAGIGPLDRCLALAQQFGFANQLDNAEWL